MGFLLIIVYMYIPQKMAKDSEIIPFYMKLSPVDKRILDGVAEAFEMSYSDIFRVALYDFAVSRKNNLMKGSLRELSRARHLQFEMQVLKELEHIGHQQAFYLDGFMNTLKSYHSKYAPVEVVRRYVTIKLISLYTLYNGRERVQFFAYIKKHFLHYYPEQRKWLEKHVNYVRSLKKNEKDELLAKLARQLPQVQKMDRGAGVRADKENALLELPAKGAEAKGIEAKGKE